jgi:hypothetical protein
MVAPVSCQLPGTAWNFLKNILTFIYNYGKLYFKESGLHADPVLQ